MRAELRTLEGLAQEVQALGLTLPDSFLRFMSDAGLRWQVERLSQTCSWFNLSNHVMRCPGFGDAYLISFMRDQQDCVAWCLGLLPGEQCRVLAVNDDALMTLSEGAYDTLLGNLEPAEISDEVIAAVRRESPTGDAAEVANRSTFICAPSFESFIYRFWIENALAAKFDLFATTPNAPLTDAEQRYADHYMGIDHH